MDFIPNIPKKAVKTPTPEDLELIELRKQRERLRLEAERLRIERDRIRLCKEAETESATYQRARKDADKALVDRVHPDWYLCSATPPDTEALAARWGITPGESPILYQLVRLVVIPNLWTAVVLLVLLWGILALVAGTSDPSERTPYVRPHDGISEGARYQTPAPLDTI